MMLLQSTYLFFLIGLSQAWTLQLFDKPNFVDNIYYRSYGPGDSAVGCTGVGTGSNRAESLKWDPYSGPEWLCTVYLYDSASCSGSALGVSENTWEINISAANKNKISAYKVTCR